MDSGAIESGTIESGTLESGTLESGTLGSDTTGLGLRHLFVSLLLALLFHAMLFGFIASQHTANKSEEAASNIVRLSFAALRTEVAEAVELTEVELATPDIIEVAEVNPMIFAEEIAAVDVFDVEVTAVDALDVTPVEEPDSQPANNEKSSVQQEQVQKNASILKEYQERIVAWLIKHKRYPDRARQQKLEGTVQLRFVLDSGGNVLEYTILLSSGHDILDREVQEMVTRAEPFPGIPDALNLQMLELTIPIEFKLR